MCPKAEENRTSRLVVLAGAFSLIAFASTQAIGGSGPNNKVCSDKTLRGDYGFQMQGSRPIGPGVSEAVIGIAVRSYDGQGYFDNVDNIKGAITGAATDRAGFGTYQVNSDCTGIASFQPDPNNPNLVVEERFVIVDDGNEVRTMTAAPGPLMITSVGKRVGRP